MMIVTVERFLPLGCEFRLGALAAMRVLMRPRDDGADGAAEAQVCRCTVVWLDSVSCCPIERAAEYYNTHASKGVPSLVRQGGG